MKDGLLTDSQLLIIYQQKWWHCYHWPDWPSTQEMERDHVCLLLPVSVHSLQYLIRSYNGLQKQTLY